MLARIASHRDFGTCPIGQGHLPFQGVTGARRSSYVWQRQVPASVRKKGLDEVAADSPDPEEENATVVDELLVEEISIDGMCGVY
jgi:mycofactocin precursor